MVWFPEQVIYLMHSARDEYAADVVDAVIDVDYTRATMYAHKYNALDDLMTDFDNRNKEKAASGQADD